MATFVCNRNSGRGRDVEDASASRRRAQTGGRGTTDRTARLVATANWKLEATMPQEPMPPPDTADAKKLADPMHSDEAYKKLINKMLNRIFAGAAATTVIAAIVISYWFFLSNCYTCEIHESYMIYYKYPMIFVYIYWLITIAIIVWALFIAYACVDISRKQPKLLINTIVYIVFFITFCSVMVFSVVWFSIGYCSLGIANKSGMGIAVEKLDILYFSVVTFTTLGYGDFIPCPNARPLAAIESITGYILMALFIAAIIALFEQIAPGRSSRGDNQVGDTTRPSGGDADEKPFGK